MPDQNPDKPNAVLLKVARNWAPPEGFEVQHRFGQFVKGLASQEALEKLDRDPDVLSHEIDLATGRFY